MAKPGCRETCGNLTIPYPFGIGPGCFYRQGFDVSCENDRVFMHNSSNQMEIYNISLLGGQVRIYSLIASKCSYINGSNTDWWVSSNTADLFTISSKANKLTAVGCNTLAFLGGFNKYSAGAGCFSMCTDKQSVDPSGQCSGMGCCQTSIAPNLTFLNITFDDRFNNSEVRGFNPCSYAFVAEQDWFKFKVAYLEDNKFTEKFKGGVPAVLDWVAGNESCDGAAKNVSSYACISKNSHCTDSPNAIGYLCTCNDGFAGNPYLEEGCQDINECSFPDQYPCHGICSNTIGDYHCSCASGTRSVDPKRETRKMAIYSDGAGEKKNLASSFLLAMKENSLQSILDRNILDVGTELLQEVAQLAKRCLNMKGEERPLMTEVAERLKIIRSTWREQLIENPSEETENLLENPSHYDPSSTGQHGSLMALDLETGR